MVELTSELQMKTDTISSNFTNRLTTDYVPCLRYGFPEDSDNPRQDPRLRPITEPIPKEAETVSPVYLLTKDQFRRQAALENPYQVRGANNIAKSLQDECEDEDRVIYPLHVESDKYIERGPEPLLEWFRTFAIEFLEIDPQDCTYYHSGSRSIHLHAPYFLIGEKDRLQNKEEIQKFSNEIGAEFDFGLYDQKRQFRLPGVVHQKTGYRKVQIGPYWNESQIIEGLTKTATTTPRTYPDVLATVYDHPPTPECSTPLEPLLSTDEIFALFGGPERAISFFDPETNSKIPLVEQQIEPTTEEEIGRWRAYNDKEFSPYAKTGNGNRSVAVIKPVGGMFGRKNVRNGSTLIPAFFYGAKGGDGDFVKYRVHAPLQLSNIDRKKWDPEFNLVVVIGGRNRQSRIIEVDKMTASITGLLLHPEEGSRNEALAYLKKQGYDVGSSGGTSTQTTNTARTRGDYEQVLPATDPRTNAGELQRRAEQNGIETLTHDERIRVACRLFSKYHWDPVWLWFKKQYGGEFKPDVAFTQLRSIANWMSADISVPDHP